MSRTTAAGHTGFVLCGGLVEELLRYEPPVHMLPNRTTPADINIAGTTIPQGSPLMLMLASGSRDPNPTLQICRRVSVVAGGLAAVLATIPAAPCRLACRADEVRAP